MLSDGSVLPDEIEFDESKMLFTIFSTASADVRVD